MQKFLQATWTSLFQQLTFYCRKHLRHILNLKQMGSFYLDYISKNNCVKNIVRAAAKWQMIQSIKRSKIRSACDDRESYWKIRHFHPIQGYSIYIYSRSCRESITSGKTRGMTNKISSTVLLRLLIHLAVTTPKNNLDYRSATLYIRKKRTKKSCFLTLRSLNMLASPP